MENTCLAAPAPRDTDFWCPPLRPENFDHSDPYAGRIDIEHLFLFDGDDVRPYERRGLAPRDYRTSGDARAIIVEPHGDDRLIRITLFSIVRTFMCGELANALGVSLDKGARLQRDMLRLLPEMGVKIIWTEYVQ
jgi:hypothetical protein